MLKVVIIVPIKIKPEKIIAIKWRLKWLTLLTNYCFRFSRSECIKTPMKPKIKQKALSIPII